MRARRPRARDRARLGADALDGARRLRAVLRGDLEPERRPRSPAPSPSEGSRSPRTRSAHLKREPHALSARARPRRGRAALGPCHQPDPHGARAFALVSDHRAARCAARACLRARAAGSARVQPRGGRRPARGGSRTGSGSRDTEALLDARRSSSIRELGVAQPCRRYVDDLERLEELAPEMLAPGRAELQPARRRTWTPCAASCAGRTSSSAWRSRREQARVPEGAADGEGVRGARPVVPRARLLLGGSRGLAPPRPRRRGAARATTTATVTYLSSDPADPGLALVDPRLRSFMIGVGHRPHDSLRPDRLSRTS